MRLKMNVNAPKRIKNAVSDENFRVFVNELPESVEIFLYGTVGDEYTESDAGSIGRVLARNRSKPVVMRINSFGGLAFDGLAIYNALADHPSHTTAIIDSVAASAASLAAIGADEVQMYENATYHIHEGIGFAVGHIAEMQETIDWLKQFNASAVTTYAAKTGMSESEVAAALLGANGDGTKYTAAEAKAAGFVDTVLTLGKPAKKQSAKAESDARLQAMLQKRLLQHRARSY